MRVRVAGGQINGPTFMKFVILDKLLDKVELMIRGGYLMILIVLLELILILDVDVMNIINLLTATLLHL